MCAVSPSGTVRVVSVGRWSSRRNETRCRPGVTSASVRGVRPALAPLTCTVAPLGSDRTDTTPPTGDSVVDCGGVLEEVSPGEARPEGEESLGGELGPSTVEALTVSSWGTGVSPDSASAEVAGEGESSAPGCCGEDWATAPEGWETESGASVAGAEDEDLDAAVGVGAETDRMGKPSVARTPA